MKIAISSDLYYPMINGVATFAHNLALGMAARGHEIMVLCPSMTGRHYKRTKGGVTTVYMKSKRLPLYPDMVDKTPRRKKLFGKDTLFYENGLWISMHPYKEVERALDKFKPDVIHNQTAEMMAMAVMKYARKNNVPVVSTGHAYPDNITGQLKALRPVKAPLDAALRGWMASFLRHSEYATVPTELALEGLIPGELADFPVTVEPLSNGVDLAKFKPGKVSQKLARKYKLDLEAPTVLYVGRVDPEKSIEYVVDAFGLVLKEVPEAKLVIVGDGTARAGLEKKVAELGMSGNVQFTGKILPPELYEVYRVGDLFVTASETETQGIVLIEAAATGLPLVAVDAGAVREVCQDGRNGALCQPGDVAALAAGMTKILQDQKLRRRYNAASLEIAATHDINKTLQRFEEIYQEAGRLKAEKAQK